MIEEHRVDWAELGQIVFERQVVATPGDDVEGGVVSGGNKEAPLKFKDASECTVSIFKPRCWKFKVPCVGQSISPWKGDMLS